MLDVASQAWFDARRTEHFPPDRLVVGAHVTMFHALPGALEPNIAAELAALCQRSAPFAVRVEGLRSLGHGVAYRLSAPPAVALRAQLARHFSAELTPQDKAGWSPHVTVQNKATREQAAATLAALSGIAAPHPTEATGLALWRYRGGPWEEVGAWSFAAARKAECRPA